MKQTRRNAFSLAEVVVAVGLLAVFFLIFLNWTKNSQNYLHRLDRYYDDRNELINKVERGEGMENNITGNLCLKTVSVNNLVVEYLINK